ncbi:hypothetical protein Aph02nite_24570 [Actinoplanes philippinensis]|uniref:HEAT repeat-containing protein n=1 Tax=Actinoplanes philippinensis TaxID=35752 RepID=A0A1I2G3C8_9ACTN|nr:HEAT repeat domain-containing protein [Actinoplanes philippinensis]GIE76507.1 hypothetical protein Aph02nite_24570 [Actinoplanes philippinensis]SFF11131.1 HEAT repeat-containing protein [Actinoplanes philippinensis]
MTEIGHPVTDLLARLAGEDPEAAREAALELGDRREYGAAPLMLEILGATSDARVRNGIAYALSAMRVPEMFEVVVELLRQERTRGFRGTLLYALRPFDCTPILPLLVDLVIGDSWEAAREAGYLITEIEVVSTDTWLPLEERLRAALEVVEDPGRREIIAFLSEFFENDAEEPA